jgi:dTDP-4-amino-4,6-dideoxygalactose transaminase
MGGDELKLIKDIFESNWIAPVGPDVDAFEREFAGLLWDSNPTATRLGGQANATTTRYVVALSAGTAAMHLALRIIGVGQGDEVFCSSLTFCASAMPVVYQGATPVFIDSDEVSWNMNPGLLDEEIKRCAKIGRLPKAVIAVHIYGQSADMDPIMKSCRKYGIPVIEDAAEALGALYKGRKVGNFGHASVFSFNGNKIITTSSGGMLVSGDKKFIDKARFLATQARDTAPHYQHSEIGFNYRMSNVLAGIGRGQLRVLEERINQKRAIFEKYRNLLGDIPGIEFMPEPEWSRSNRWLTCVLIDPDKFGKTREDVRLKLEEYNIESRPLWKPMHMQPVFKGCRVCGGEVSSRFFEQGLCLPSGTALKNEEIEFICSRIKELK